MMKKILISIPYFLLFLNMAFATEVSTFFNRDCEKAIINKISEAKKEIRVAIYSFTRFSIARALIKAQQSGIKVEVITDAKQANTEYGDKIIKLLKINKIPVFLISKKDHSHMHHKFTVIDNFIVLNGSFNYSTNATKFSDENLVIIKDQKIAKEFLNEWQRLFRIE